MNVYLVSRKDVWDQIRKQPNEYYLCSINICLTVSDSFLNRMQTLELRELDLRKQLERLVGTCASIEHC